LLYSRWASAPARRFLPSWMQRLSNRCPIAIRQAWSRFTSAFQ
jgi:hypothetical protein